MLIVPITETVIRKRQRAARDKTKFAELKSSIAQKGVLHPPVFWRDDAAKVWVLNVGEGRYRSIQELHAAGVEVRCNSQTIPPGCMPITILDDRLDEIGRFETELDENVIREDLPWPDRVQAYADLHKMRQVQNPKQTKEDTAKELVQRGLVNALPTGRLHMKQATLIAEHLDNDKIANARNPAEALTLIYKMEEEKVTAALVQRRLATIPAASTIKITQGSCLDLLPGLDSDMADLILIDPPYGIGASSGGFRGRTVHHHNYEDTPENAKKIAQTVLTDGFRICKARANLFMFCDIDLFPWLKLTASNMGWDPFRRPLIWRKSESEGLAPWGAQGPRITTEFIFFATKGSRGLNASPIDVFDDKRVSRSERLHAAEKPVDLLKKLIQCSTLPGDFVLDPCCGSGSTLVAAKELKRHGLGIELDKDYYNTALSNVFGSELNAQST